MITQLRNTNVHNQVFFKVCICVCARAHVYVCVCVCVQGHKLFKLGDNI